MQLFIPQSSGLRRYAVGSNKPTNRGFSVGNNFIVYKLRCYTFVIVKLSAGEKCIREHKSF